MSYFSSTPRKLTALPDVGLDWGRFIHTGADLVYLIRFRLATADTAEAGHVCELQLALEPMVTARSAMDGHAAYANARHKIEILKALGISIEGETDAAGTLSPGHAIGVESPEKRNITLAAMCTELMAENASLKKELAALKQRFGVVDASGTASTTTKKKKRSMFRFRSKSRDSARESSGE